jgi:ELWxxDGT repeat protein
MKALQRSRPVRLIMLKLVVLLSLLSSFTPGAALAAGSPPELFFEETTTLDAISAAGFAQLPNLAFFTLYKQGPDFGFTDIWRTDGTVAGTKGLGLANTNPGLSINEETGITVPELGLFFFTAYDPVRGTELWRSDGTSAAPITNFPSSAADDPAFDSLIAYKGRLYFWLKISDNQFVLWKSDGTAVGTAPLYSPPAEAYLYSPLVIAGNYFYFVTNEQTLYRSDGTTNGTVILLEEDYLFPSDLSVAGDILYFRLPNPDPFIKLWRLGKTDGTVAGTVVIDAYFRYDDIDYFEHIGYKGRFFFVSRNDVLHTVISDEIFDVHDTNPNGEDSVGSLVVIGDLLYFTAYDDEENYVWWQSDGTSAGTVKVANGLPEPTTSVAPRTIGNITYFSAFDQVHGQELWQTWGNLAEASLVGNIALGNQDSNPGNFFVLNNQLFFTADGPRNEPSVQIWRAKPPKRAANGLLALYEFEEGSGNLVRDTSGVGNALDLRVARVYNHQWVDGGLRMRGSAVLRSRGAAAKINTPTIAKRTLTIEAWVKPDSIEQFSARILTISPNPTVRNITLAQGSFTRQDSSEATVRLRTSTTRGDGKEWTTGTGTLQRKLVHLVMTINEKGVLRMFVNGQLQVDTVYDGDFSTWNRSYPLLLGNEALGGRGWKGTYYLVAFYDRALSKAEVEQNYSAGP